LKLAAHQGFAEAQRQLGNMAATQHSTSSCAAAASSAVGASRRG
jgi:hypothetical protein